ncbi:MAG TPA: serine/threonine-protein kinase [Polyangiaceae bacterium]|nr:serine/threonine-protein kinase [Polyangiaceae bacterium]
MLGELDLPQASLFAGRYRIVRRIAAGGMGAVFEVVHTETQRRRALKIMLPELLHNQQLRERFQLEARVTANVESEHIVDVFDAGIDDGTGMPFLVMELLNGQDLGRILDLEGPLTPERTVAYLRQVASALDKTHAAGIVHRDLKPENLFLTHREDGTPRVKILDFGISKVVNEAPQTARVTRGLGTPLYMAPEQALAQTVGPPTDLYALALIAYSLLVGTPYWQREASQFENAIAFVVHTSRGATEGAVGRARDLGQSLPDAFDAWFRRATALDPAQRFETATELVNELGLVFGIAPAPQSRTVGSARHTPAAQARVSTDAQTIAAKTAPGTELDRQGTLAGAATRGRALRRFGVVGGVVVAALLGLVALRSQLASSSSPDVARAPAAAPAPTPAPVPLPSTAAPVAAATPAAPEPVVSIAGIPSAAPTPSAADGRVKRPPAVKRPSTGGKAAPAKSAAGATTARSSKYTRD